MCSFLTFAMCADPAVAGAIAFEGMTVPIVWSHVRVRSCMDTASGAPGDGAGLARFDFEWTAQRDTSTDGRIAGRIVVRLSDVRIELTAFEWDRMSPSDGKALQRTYRATLWHELGHLATAKTSIDAANAGAAVVADDQAAFAAAMRLRGDAAFARLRADQDVYDRLSDHGLRQSALPPPLGGDDTVIDCTKR